MPLSYRKDNSISDILTNFWDKKITNCNLIIKDPNEKQKTNKNKYLKQQWEKTSQTSKRKWNTKKEK